MLGINFETESYTKYKNDSFLPREVMQWVWRQYLTEESKTSRFAVPQLSTKEQLEGLPPALIITAEKDVLRDDGEAYQKQLKQAGVNTVALRYFGVVSIKTILKNHFINIIMYVSFDPNINNYHCYFFIFLFIYNNQ